MRAPPPSSVCLAIAIMLTLSTLQSAGAWNVARLTDSATPSTAPRVLFDATDNLHVFWEEAGGIHHLWRGSDGWHLPPTVVADGTDLEIGRCPTCAAVYAIWNDGGAIRLCIWSSQAWHGIETPPLAGLGTASQPHVVDAAGPNAVWVETNGNGESWILHSIRPAAAWTPARLVAGPFTEDRLQPRIQPRDPGGGLSATWMEEMDPVSPGLHGAVWDHTTWQAIGSLFEGWGGRFDVDPRVGLYRSDYVAHSIQPSCPCNDVVHVSGTPGDWTEPEWIATDLMPFPFNWPQDVRIGVSPTGWPHVVWRHECYTDLLELADERLVYAVKMGDTWVHDLDLAVGRNARQPDVAVGLTRVAIVWSDDSQGNFDIYLATDALVDTPEGASADPVAGSVDTPGPSLLRLLPNPAAGPVTIEMDRSVAPPGARVEAAIHDVTGRAVCFRSFPAPLPGNIRWIWDGRDAGGTPVPAGVYRVRVRIGDTRVARSIVVVR